MCPIDSDANNKFEIIQDFKHRFIDKFESFMAIQILDVTAFEFICDKNNIAYTYDINTNYSSEAETLIAICAYKHLAQFLSDETNSQQHLTGEKHVKPSNMPYK